MKDRIKLWHSVSFLILFALLFVGISCREDDPTPDPTNAANEKIDSWILENMEFWYLWNNELPGSPDKNLDPAAFFESLLVDEDRFSWIQENYQELLNSLKGINKEAGYEFVLYKEQNSDNVFGQILYTKPASPAETAGLKRGDKFTHINGQQMTLSNYQQLLGALKENHSLLYEPMAENGNFGAPQTVSLTVVEYAENPNYLSKIIEVGDKKIGYYVYNFFAAGPDNDSEVYDEGMEGIFADFKSAGVTDLVLDLRFNSGGSESSANNLASLIGKGVDESKDFARREYNNDVETAIINDPNYGPDFLVTKFLNQPANIGQMLEGSRVYVLTSSRTASASELVINALKPYMEVFLIGDVTYGKNVGSISLYEPDDPENTWGMQPIVVKVYNSLDQSDYSNGFQPDIENKDNSLFLKPLGDENETLLKAAIAQITGTADTGRAPAGPGLEVVGHSLDLKRGSYNLVIDQKIGLELQSHQGLF